MLPELELRNCPLLADWPQGTLPLLTPSDIHISLADLQSDCWWELLPDHLQDCWRRCSGIDSCLFSPHWQDLMWEPQQQQQQDAAAGGGSSSSGSDRAAICALARALFWARWLMGEPVIVRGIQVCAQGCCVAWHLPKDAYSSANCAMWASVRLMLTPAAAVGGKLLCLCSLPV